MSCQALTVKARLGPLAYYGQWNLNLKSPTEFKFNLNRDLNGQVTVTVQVQVARTRLLRTRDLRS